MSGTWVPTHKPSQKYNRYRTSPPRHGKLRDAEPIQYRNPYAFKARTRRKEHDRPPAMVQLKYNGYKEPPAAPAPTAAKESKASINSAISSLRKDDVLRALESENPTVCLSIGSLQGKINRVLADSPPHRKEVLGCIRNAVAHAWAVKYRSQKLIGMFIESTFSSGKDIRPLDHCLLDAICARIPTMTDVGSDENDEEETKDQSTKFGTKGGLECQAFSITPRISK